MPTETAIVIAAIVAVFVTYGIALAWADHYTRGHGQPKS
jgi:hypothetical protein